MKADVVIIGTGPAGAMAACRLATTGQRVVIVEQATLPRHKACGGAMPTFVQEWFDGDLTPAIDNRVSTTKYLYDSAQAIIRRSAPLLMVSRSRFDAYLVQTALARGGGLVTLREGFRVSQVEETPDRVIVLGNSGERVEAPYLIAGDGARGVTARCLGLNPAAASGLAVDAEVEVNPDVYEAHRETATFDFFCVPHGYGWIFPKGPGLLSCGVGAWAGRPNLMRGVRDLLIRHFPDGSARLIRTRGHPIPLYAGHQTIATRRVCLTGDAASLVDPVMGEGIRFALQSGLLAGDVVAGLSGVAPGATDAHTTAPQGQADCRRYQALIHEGLGQQLDNVRRFVQFVFLQAPEFFYRKFVREGIGYGAVAAGLAWQAEARNGDEGDGPAAGGVPA